MTLQDSTITSNIHTINNTIADHYTIKSNITFRKKYTDDKKLIKFRSLSQINYNKFKFDFTNTYRFQNITNFNDSLTSLINVHAPIKSKTITNRTNIPWYNKSLNVLKNNLRKAERLYKFSNSIDNLNRFISLRSTYRHELITYKNLYYNNKLLTFTNNPRKTFKIAYKLLYKNTKTNINDIPFTPDDFSNYFTSKIIDIRSKVEINMTKLSNNNPYTYDQPLTDCTQLSKFKYPNDDDISTLIKQTNSSSILDPVPTTVLKTINHFITPIIRQLLTDCIKTNTIPPYFKQASITPRIKKSNMDINVLSNYRPISQLPTLAKIFERIISKQLINHLNSNSLFDKYQSGYRKFYSTETALLYVTDNLLHNIDNNTPTQVILLDLSSAFDTIDHNILLNRLKLLNINNDALNLLKDYITNRTYNIKLKSISPNKPLLFGVPQGTVLGPLLYSLYITPISRIFLNYPEIIYHLYADDIIIMSPIHNSRLNNCIIDLRNWMTTNYLFLNSNKTTLLNISNKLSHFPTIYLDDTIIYPQYSTKYLGGTLTSDLTMTTHINSVAKSTTTHLIQLCKIRKSLPSKTVYLLANALIFSRLDYCSTLLTNSTKLQLLQLDRIIKSTTRLIFNKRKFDRCSISSLMSSLNILTIDLRIKTRLTKLIHTVLYKNTPTYLTDLLHLKKCIRPLRNSNSKLLTLPTINRKQHGGRAFRYMAASTWNNLPDEIRKSTIYRRSDILKNYIT